MMTTVDYVNVDAIFNAKSLTDDEISYLLQNWDAIKTYYKGLCFYSNKLLATHFVEYWGRNAEGKMLFVWDTTSDHTQVTFVWVDPDKAVDFVKRALWMGGIKVMAVPVPKCAYAYWGLIE